MKAPAEEKQCVHFWVIESSDEATSIGRGKICGMVKEFYNEWTTEFTNALTERVRGIFPDN